MAFIEPFDYSKLLGKGPEDLELLETHWTGSEIMAQEYFEQERIFCSRDSHHTPYENRLRQIAFWALCQATGEMP